MIISCPLRVYCGKTKKFSINLNQYRNTNYHALNKAKTQFYAEVIEQVKKLPEFERVAVTFVLYPQTKRRMDTSNVCSIAEKFLMDVVVREGKLPDDDYHHHTKTTYLFGEVDKHNPRVDAVFISDNQEE